MKGLKQLFPIKVAVFTLDEENSRRRKVSTDFVVRIGYDEIEPEDIVLLRQTLNLTEPGRGSRLPVTPSFREKLATEDAGASRATRKSKSC